MVNVKDWISGRSAGIAHVAAHVDMHVVVRIALKPALAGKEISEAVAGGGIDLPRGVGSGTGVPAGATVGIEDLAAGILKRSGQMALRRRNVIPIRQRPRAVSGHFADDPLKPVKIHAMP